MLVRFKQIKIKGVNFFVVFGEYWYFPFLFNYTHDSAFLIKPDGKIFHIFPC